MITTDWLKPLALRIIHSLEEPRLEDPYQISNTKNRNGEPFAHINSTSSHQRHFAKVSVQNMNIVNSGFQEAIPSDIH